MLGDDYLFVFDEFTSVVDRQVARIGSFAIQKAIRKTDRQFIACTCHYDVEEWLLPDWIFNTDTMAFQLSQKKNRPKLNFKIFECDKSLWKMFARHHYLSAEHSPSAKSYIGLINDQPCVFLSTNNMPHAHRRNLRKVHRLVVTQDFQGIGIGILMLTEIAKIYGNSRLSLGITTSSPALIFGLKRNISWLCKRIGTNKPNTGSLTKLNKTTSVNRVTATFEYKTPEIVPNSVS
jgi:hypothetical protein